MAIPTCPESCGAQVLPVVSFDDCLPQLNSSEIEDLFLAKATAAAFTDWTDPEEWADRLAQTGVTGTEIRRLTGIGDKPAPADTEKTVSKQRNVVTDRTHTLNFTIDDTNNTNYEAARQMQCGGKYLAWYKTRGMKQYGGNAGILVTVKSVVVLGRGDEHELIQLTLTWKNKFDPERDDAVM